MGCTWCTWDCTFQGGWRWWILWWTQKWPGHHRHHLVGSKTVGSQLCPGWSTASFFIISHLNMGWWICHTSLFHHCFITVSSLFHHFSFEHGVVNLSYLTFQHCFITVSSLFHHCFIISHFIHLPSVTPPSCRLRSRWDHQEMYRCHGLMETCKRPIVSALRRTQVDL